MLFEEYLVCPWCAHRWEAEPPTASAHYDYQEVCPKCGQLVTVITSHVYATRTVRGPGRAHPPQHAPGFNKSTPDGREAANGIIPPPGLPIAARTQHSCRPGDDLITQIIEVAHLHGWLVQRPAWTGWWRTAVQGDAGFPDLTMARGGRVIFAVCKRDNGSLSPEQWLWAGAIATGGEYYVWRRRDWEEVVALLAGVDK